MHNLPHFLKFKQAKTVLFPNDFEIWQRYFLTHWFSLLFRGSSTDFPHVLRSFSSFALVSLRYSNVVCCKISHLHPFASLIFATRTLHQVRIFSSVPCVDSRVFFLTICCYIPWKYPIRNPLPAWKPWYLVLYPNNKPSINLSFFVENRRKITNSYPWTFDFP